VFHRAIYSLISFLVYYYVKTRSTLSEFENRMIFGNPLLPRVQLESGRRNVVRFK